MYQLYISCSGDGRKLCVSVWLAGGNEVQPRFSVLSLNTLLCSRYEVHLQTEEMKIEIRKVLCPGNGLSETQGWHGQCGLPLASTRANMLLEGSVFTSCYCAGPMDFTLFPRHFTELLNICSHSRVWFQFTYSSSFISVHFLWKTSNLPVLVLSCCSLQPLILKTVLLKRLHLLGINS